MSEKKQNLLVDEIFHSIQGEGPNSGKSSLFIRFSKCNLSCAHCDSKHSWLSKNSVSYTLESLLFDIIKLKNVHNFNNLVLTGGEPFVQGEQVALLVRQIQNWSTENSITMTIEIETNGSLLNAIFPDSKVHFNVSPKLNSFPQSTKNGKMEKYTSNRAYSYLSLRSYRDEHAGCSYSFKFVVSPDTIDEDLKEIQDIQKQVNIPNHNIYLMPEGIKAEEQALKFKEVFDKTKNLGYNYSLRTHIIIWDGCRAK